jgi:diguanylate cyclase (GGDEF)-like protein
MLDLDRFKLVNDTLGHGVGDAFLRRVVAEVRRRLRAGDVLCRMGGDEFVLLLPGTDEAGALQLADRLQEAVSAARAEFCPDVPVGGSFGAAAQRGGALDAAALLQHADAAMYAAKRAGGSRTLAWRRETAQRLGLVAPPRGR